MFTHIQDLLKKNFSREHLSAGLDIGADFVRAVKLQSNGSKVVIRGLDSKPSQQDLKKALKELKESLGLEVVNIGLSGPSVVIRYINFPRMSESELAGALKFEAEKHIPFPLAEVVLDSHILKEDFAENKMLVLIAAVKKDYLNQRLSLMGEAGLKCAVVDINSLAVINAFKFSFFQGQPLKEKVIALVNVDSTASLDILEGGLPFLSRDIQASADISRLEDELRTSFDYYESQSASSVEKVFLSGSGACSGELKESFASGLGLEVECWDPLKSMELADGVKVNDLKGLSAQFAVAVGLALR